MFVLGESINSATTGIALTLLSNILFYNLLRQSDIAIVIHTTGRGCCTRCWETLNGNTRTHASRYHFCGLYRNHNIPKCLWSRLSI